MKRDQIYQNIKIRKWGTTYQNTYPILLTIENEQVMRDDTAKCLLQAETVHTSHSQ